MNGGSHQSTQQEVPLPVSLTLYNLHVPSSNNTTTPTTTSFCRPEYTSDLLVPVRLDIVFSPSSHCSDDDDDEHDEILLYSATTTQKSIHPTWQHLEEKIEALNDVSSRSSIYPNCKCKLVAIMNQSEEVVLLDNVSLYPLQLRRLPEESNPEEGANTTMNVAWTTHAPPKQLPPNAVLIHYTDGSTRVCPPLYHFLVSACVIKEVDLRDASFLQDEQEEYKRQARFDDDVFDTLDQVVWWQQSQEETKRRPSPLSLLETDDESQAIIVKSLHETANNEEAVTLSATRRNGKEYDVHENITNGNIKSSSPSSEIESTIQDLQREKQQLEQLLEEEEALLQEELAMLQESETALKEQMERVRQVKEETKLIRIDVADERRKQENLEYCLEAQRIKLLDELRMIYPIRCQAQDTWLIRGQEIPHDLHAGGISEEEISAALGFMCHSVFMISKYLSIPLRYRIVCSSSRSAVQENATTILPLFQARMVEREELDRAMTLMERNVACILKTRGILYIEDSHILCKVNRIYESIVDGAR